MASQIHHTNIQVSDVARSLTFYDRLGLTLLGRLRLDHVVLYYVGCPDGDVLLELADNPALTERVPGSGHVALVVDDLDALLDRLAAKGIVPESAPFHPAGRDELRICFVRDPDGVRIELIDGEFAIPHE
jgi:lactoylglutathione lyase